MRCDIAVLGGHALLPGAASASAWASLCSSAIRPLPAGRALAPLGAPHDLGGWLEALPRDPGVDPGDDDLAHLVTATARGALAGLDVDFARTGLVLATLSLPSTHRMRATGASWCRGLGVPHPAFHGIETPASRVGDIAARALGLRGPRATLDAACASGLFAAGVAAQWLRNGRCDAVVVVGASLADPWYLQSGFFALGALSPTGRSRPLHEGADGLCVAEGAAALVLAQPRSGAWAHLVSLGLGTGAPRGNPLAPDSEAQRGLLADTWAGLDPSRCQLVEAHATGTAAGDRAELRALAPLLSGAALHSFKAWTGHPLTASGVAGLLRAALAIREAVLPAMPVDEPLPEARPFRLLDRATPWDGPRWAAVSAFGMGGTLGHAVLSDEVPPGPTRAAPARMRVVASSSRLVEPAAPVAVSAGRWRVPPREIAAWLPTQALALDALGDVASDAIESTRLGVVVALRPDAAPGDALLAAALGAAGLAVEGLAPPLDADRVLGSLGNLVANRFSNQRCTHGPSVALLGEAEALGAALDLASSWLGDGTCDEVLLAAVDVGDHPSRARPGTGGFALRLRAAGEGEPAIEPPEWSGAEGHEPAPDLASALVADGAATLGSWAVRWTAGRGALCGAGQPDQLVATAAPRPRLPRWSAPWDGGVLPIPLPRQPPNFVRPAAEALGDPEPLPWPARKATPPAAVETRDDLLDAFVRHRRAVADAHEAFLALRGAAADALGALAGTQPTGRPARERAPAPAVPRALDRAALEAHATGLLSEAFGPGWADLDGIRPRVRMPAPPLLLCHRVLSIEGTPRVPGPAAIVTEYDIPDDGAWNDGRPPACVVVESGQADLLLASWLGIDAWTQGRAVYRLLDCDLEFHAERPVPGRTIRHEIRIARVSRLRDTVLFWFQYDATVDGQPVLSMRNGTAGFFPASELARPQGVSAAPSEATAMPVAPIAASPPSSLDGDGLDALSRRPGVALARPPWRLGHRVPHVSHRGGPHGLGRVLIAQDLADDDWFNGVHFVDDPCMPGTLMFEGCAQALHVWLLTAGAADGFEEGRFEPLTDRPVRLRCRGQVAPGHRSLVYEAFVREACLDGPEPYAVADVVLSVDGRAVVRATDVGARIVGRRGPDARTASALIEFAVGRPSAAFGARLSAWDAPGRCARMAGPPLDQIGVVLAVDGPPGVVRAPATVRTATNLAASRALHRADPGPIPFGVLLETLLQPCGWLTAWQGAGLSPGRVLAFRNLDGDAVLHRVPRPGRVEVEATQDATALSGGVRICVFRTSLRDAEGALYEATTRFGYFGPDALARQAGLSDTPEPDGGAGAVREALDGHPALPRSDGRFLDRLVCRRPDLVVAEADVDPGAWFFEAHFLGDPVMPGSLGLDGLVQLARVVHFERTGRRGTVLPGRHRWTYRGQVLPQARLLRFEWHLVADPDGAVAGLGVVRVDGVPIYRLEGLRVGDAPEDPVALRPERHALLDEFDATSGRGSLRLDPADQPWLDDHRPTRADPAVPLAMSVAIAVEAAARFRPGRLPTGVPLGEALRWLAVPPGGATLDIAAQADGDEVLVELGIGGTVGARVRVSFEGPQVALGDVDPGPTDPRDAGAFAAAGHTFHGPSLSRISSLAVGPSGGTARVAPGPLAGPFDPHALDGATWPMSSANPERWGCTPGLAYPVRLEALVWTRRPDGAQDARVRVVEASGRRLAFEVALVGPGGVCARCRWVETVVPPGPLLGFPAAQRRAFLWDRAPAGVHLGRPDGDGWQVTAADLVEPMPRTIASFWTHPDDDPSLSLVDLVAAKECVRQRIDAHPSAIRLVRLSDGVAVVAVDDAPVDLFLASVGPRVGRVDVAGGRARWRGPRPDLR